MIVKQSSDIIFFHMMEALSGTQKLRNGFKKGDTAELLNWKKKQIF